MRLALKVVMQNDGDFVDVKKGIPRQAEVAQGVPGRLRPRIFSTFGTTRMVGRQPNAPAAFTPGEIPGTHFQRLSRPQGTWFCRQESCYIPLLHSHDFLVRAGTPVAVYSAVSFIISCAIN